MTNRQATKTRPSDRFTTVPDVKTLADTVVALEEHGFSVEVVDDLDAASRRPHPGAGRLLNLVTTSRSSSASAEEEETA